MTTFKKTDIALVTGAGSGIGRETCRLLSSQGATVVATDVNEKAVNETLTFLTGNNNMSLKLDVTKKKEVEDIISKVKVKYSSPPTIVVNCAGLVRRGSLLECTEEEYNRLFDTNVKGTVWVTQVACRELVAAKQKGSMINMSSITADGYPTYSIYVATKAAVESFSKSVAREFGSQGIRCNAILPGVVDTPILRAIDEVTLNAFIQEIPMKRIAKPQEIAEVVAFLASDKSSYVNGAAIRVHGGSR